MTLTPSQRNMAVSALVLAAFVALYVWSLQITDARGREFPVLVSGAAIVLCVFDLIAQTQTGIGRRLAHVLSGSTADSLKPLGHGIKIELVAVAWVIVATAVMVLAGFLAGIPLYVFGYSLLHARRTVRQSAVAAVATTVAIWVGFELLLNYDLYSGLLFAS